jgi:hypothetical protein
MIMRWLPDPEPTDEWRELWRVASARTAAEDQLVHDERLAAAARRQRASAVARPPDRLLDRLRRYSVLRRHRAMG